MIIYIYDIIYRIYLPSWRWLHISSCTAYNTVGERYQKTSKFLENKDADNRKTMTNYYIFYQNSPTKSCTMKPWCLCPNFHFYS